MENSLNKMKVAILLTDGFEQVELTEPRAALDAQGAITHLIAPMHKEVKAWNGTEWGEAYPVDVPLESARPSYYDALLLPGGVMNPDALRTNKEAIDFIKYFFDAGKPVAAICHGPQLLIEADVVRGRRLTSYCSLQTDLNNAGATWLDEPVVVSDGLVTSRKPDDIPVFNQAMIALFGKKLTEA